MNKLLQTIKKNDEDFDEWISSIVAYAVNQSDELGMQKNYVKSQFKKSRIKEVEALVKIIKKKEKTWGGYDGEEIVDDKQVFGHNEAMLDIEIFLEDTIKQLKN